MMIKFGTAILMIVAACFAGQTLQAHSIKADNAENTVASTKIEIFRDFVPGPFGQVHVRIAKPPIKTENPPLVLFHPTPYSGDYFTTFMQIMAKDRIVIAIDTPGYGDSTRPASLQTIAGYAKSASAALAQLGYGGDDGRKVDLLGYHTGCLIVAELAIQQPNLVRRIALPGIPFFVGEGRKKAYENIAKPTAILADGSHLLPKWRFSTGAVKIGLPMERGQQHFSDSLQCSPFCWEAYHAVFTYESEKQFPKVAQPVLLITNASSLKAETEAAQIYLANSKLVHMPEVTLGGFDLHTEKIADAVRDFLDE